MHRLLPFLALALALAACGGDIETPADDFPADTARVAAVPTVYLPPDLDGPLVVYAAQDSSLVGPLVARFRETTGIEVEVRYGEDAGLLARIQEEGDRTSADVFWASSTGPLAFADEADLLTVLPDSFRVLPAAFVPASGEWVPVTVRFRVMAYAPSRVDSTALPRSVTDLPSAALAGRVGWAPTTSSFQDALTAYRLEGGDEAAREWLAAMQEAGVIAYPSASAMLGALGSGEIDAALVDHDDALRSASDSTALATAFFAPGDVGNLALVTGAGVLDTSGRQRAARRFVAFLLSRQTQTALAEVSRVMPVVAGAPAPEGFVPFETALDYGPRLDVRRLRDLDATRDFLRDAGLLE